MARPLAIGVLLIVTANVLGGVAYPIQSLALDGLPPATITLLRNVVALLPLWFLMRRREARYSDFNRSEKLRLVFLGTVAYALPMLLGILGVQYSTAANASVLVLLEPVMIVLVARFYLGEVVGRNKLLGVGVGLAGAMFIVLEGASLRGLLAGENFGGNVLLALHGLLWGLHTPVVKPLSDRHDPFAITFYTIAWSIPLTAVGAGFEVAGGLDSEGVGSALLWCLVLGLGISFGATASWIASLRYLPATTVAPFVFLQPFAGGLVAVFALGDVVTTMGLMGAALILIGVGLAISGKR